MVYCPYHNNYRTPAGEISKTTGMFFCFACYESHNLCELVMFLTKKTYFESVRIIDSFATDLNTVDMLNSILQKNDDLKPYDESMIERLHIQALDSFRAMNYYSNRLISVESIKRFKLGYSENQDMVIIPVKDPSGRFFVGFVARSVEGKDFKNTPGLPKSKVLFNLHNAKKYDTVYVVESSFDAIRLDQNGMAAVATLGANVTNNQIELLKKYFNNVAVVADNDDAGKSMQNLILDKVGKRATIIPIPQRFKDVGEMQDADIQELITRIKDPLLLMY